MHPARLSPSLLVVPFALLAGCSESAPVTASTEVPATGADVNRTLEIITALTSGNLGLTVAFEDLEGFCTGGEFTISPQRGQAVFLPSDKVQLHTKTRAAFVQVFDLSGLGEITDLCDLLQGPVVASGRVTFSQVVHEVPDDAPGAFSLHATVVGVVDRTAGGQGRLHATWQFVVRPNGITVRDVSRIRLRPI